MSKQTSLLLAILVLLAVVVLTDLANPSSQAHSLQQPSVTETSARNAAIVAATDEVLKATSEIRELAILRPVKSGAQSREMIEKMLV